MIKICSTILNKTIKRLPAGEVWCSRSETGQPQRQSHGPRLPAPSYSSIPEEEARLSSSSLAVQAWVDVYTWCLLPLSTPGVYACSRFINLVNAHSVTPVLPPHCFIHLTPYDNLILICLKKINRDILIREYTCTYTPWLSRGSAITFRREKLRFYFNNPFWGKKFPLLHCKQEVS